MTSYCCAPVCYYVIVRWRGNNNFWGISDTSYGAFLCSCKWLKTLFLPNQLFEKTSRKRSTTLFCLTSHNMKMVYLACRNLPDPQSYWYWTKTLTSSYIDSNVSYASLRHYRIDEERNSISNVTVLFLT